MINVLRSRYRGSGLAVALLCVAWALCAPAAPAEDGDAAAEPLREAVAAYIVDRIRPEGRDPGLYDRLTKAHGKRDFVLELHRQFVAMEGGVDDKARLLWAILSGYHAYPELAESALESAEHAEHRQLSLRSASWLARNVELLDAEQAARAREIVPKRFEESRDKSLRWAVRYLAEPGDVARIRRVFEQHFAATIEPGDLHRRVAKLLEEGGRYPRHPVTNHPTDRVGLLGFHPWDDYDPPTTASDLLVILAELGDPKALEFIRQAIRQDEAVTERAWGLLVVSELGDPAWLDEVTPLLDDSRIIPIMLGEWRAEGDEKNRPLTMQRGYKRISDLAIEVGFGLTQDFNADPAESGWSFRTNRPKYGPMHIPWTE